MLNKRLRALGFLEWEKVDPNNPQHFRKVTIWLEDQKIRHYKIEERSQLRETQNDNWLKVFERYCEDVGCPIRGSHLAKLEWLTGHALWLEISGNHEKYHDAVEKKQRRKKEMLKPTIKSSNPLDNLDFDSKEFRAGVTKIAKLLRVPRHPDHLTTLEACSKLVRSRLNVRIPKTNVPSKTDTKNKCIGAMEVAPGFNLKEKGLENAAKGLALLYIQDLRDLQTKINEAIVVVQTITANPKTDTKLGKVGK